MTDEPLSFGFVATASDVFVSIKRWLRLCGVKCHMDQDCPEYRTPSATECIRNWTWTSEFQPQRGKNIWNSLEWIPFLPPTKENRWYQKDEQHPNSPCYCSQRIKTKAEEYGMGRIFSGELWRPTIASNRVIPSLDSSHSISSHTFLLLAGPAGMFL